MGSVDIADFLAFTRVFGSECDGGSGGGGGGSGSPDLIVESPSVSDNTLTTGQSFTLSAAVRNQGNGQATATTLRYYRSSNATISASDTEVGTDSVSGLSASGTSAESISLNAPSSAGTYYYGACVVSVSGESNTNNNCSTGVRITVSSSSGSGGSGSGVLVTGMTNLTNNSRHGHSSKPAWSPDGRFIAFSHNIVGHSTFAISVMGPDGDNRTRLFESRTQILTDVGTDFHWSPDSRFIIFESMLDGSQRARDIYKLDLDGNLTQLTLNPAEDGSPTWSPDGRFIAFYSRRAGQGPSTIFRMDSDGSNVTSLYSGDAGSPIWSPDGRFIAFHDIDHSGEGRQIRMMDPDGSNLTGFLIPADPYNDYASGSSVWSPDSRFIAFHSFSRYSPSQIYVLNLDGNNLTRVTNHPATDEHPAWSPDGRFIAFVSQRDENGKQWLYEQEIYIVGRDGNNLTRVTNNSYDNNPARDDDPIWSPDGRFIIFSSEREGYGSPSDIYRVEIKFGAGGETILTFPDINLNQALGHSLGKMGRAPSVTTAELAALRTLDISNKNISDLTGLEHATNLTELNLSSNRIADIALLARLTKLTRLLLGGNNISDIASLVANTGLGSGDTVDLRDNPLSPQSRNTHIPALRARGVNVRF